MKKILCIVGMVVVMAFSSLSEAGGYSSGGYSSSRSYSSPSRSYSSPSYKSPSYQSKPITSAPVRPSYSRPPTVVEHHYYNHGGGCCGGGGTLGNMWFWMWAMDQNRQQPVYVNGVPQQPVVGGSTTVIQDTSVADRWLTVALHIFLVTVLLASLILLIYGVVWLFRGYRTY